MHENNTFRLCQALLDFGVNRRRALTNLVMGLSAHDISRSVVEISESEFFHYHYSNINKVLHDLGDRLAADSSTNVLSLTLMTMLKPFFPPPRRMADGRGYYAFTSDLTKIIKAHSPCLEGRTYVQTANNVIAGNRPLSVGYGVAVTHLGAGEAGWCPPLSMAMLEVGDDGTAVVVAQIKALMDAKDLPFGTELCLERADSGFGKAAFLSPLYAIDNLVSIVRLRQSMRVWAQADTEPSGGAPRIYGEKFYLTGASVEKAYHRTNKKTGVKTTYSVYQQSIMDKKADDIVQYETVMANQRPVIIRLHRWNDLLLHSKNGHNMKQTRFDVVRVEVLDGTTQKPVFDRPMFLAVSGKRKTEIQTKEAHLQYRERYDVESYYRFAKQNLLLDKLQTPDHDHLQQWLRIVQIASWMLFTAKRACEVLCPTWQKYLPENQKAIANVQQPLTIAQTRKAIKTLFRTFDKTPFLPLKCKKGKGRVKGQKLTRRKTFPVLRKIKKNSRKFKMQRNE